MSTDFGLYSKHARMICIYAYIGLRAYTRDVCTGCSVGASSTVYRGDNIPNQRALGIVYFFIPGKCNLIPSNGFETNITWWWIWYCENLHSINI